jgi:hypothetical protein
MDSARLYHLEIETKHGQVSLIHHRTGQVFCDPPVPPDAAGPRQQRDLTGQVPGAFDGRPRIETAEALNGGQGRTGYRFTFSTGASFSFHLDDRAPSLIDASGD